MHLKADMFFGTNEVKQPNTCEQLGGSSHLLHLNQLTGTLISQLQVLLPLYYSVWCVSAMSATSIGAHNRNFKYLGVEVSWPVYDVDNSKQNFFKTLFFTTCVTKDYKITYYIHYNYNLSLNKVLISLYFLFYQ